jgi:hypothetical protein
MITYVVGALCAVIGIYLATITRLYIFTGKTTHPYLAAGIVLAIVGFGALGGAQLVAKGKLSK